MTQPVSGRLDSIDALRGFDMFFITGGASLIHALSAACPAGFLDLLDAQMRHMAWDGFTFYDMVFPLFLFIAGLSFPFSLAKSRERHLPERQIVWNILRRTLVLIVLGLIFNGLLRLDFSTMRYASVLGRIGIAWGAAALLYRCCSRRMLLVLSVLILLLYGCAVGLLRAPDAPGDASPLSLEGNIVGYVDRLFLPGRLLGGHFDPLGILSTFPAVVTALSGMFVSDLVRHGSWTSRRRMSWLVGTGLLLVVAGLLLDRILPINKSLWSSSYVCFAGGLSTLLFALFYWLIDVRGWKRWSFYFRVIGLNSITIYMLQKIVPIRSVSDFFFGGLAGYCPGEWGGVVLSAGYLLVAYAFLKFLYDNKVFLKV